MQGVDEYHDDGDPRPYIGAPDLFVGRGGQVSGTPLWYWIPKDHPYFSLTDLYS